MFYIVRKVADTPDISKVTLQTENECFKNALVNAAGTLFTRVRAKKAFDRAKEEGLVTVVRARIHLVGKDGAGKT